MKKIISWILTLVIIAFLILLTERIYLYNFTYKYIMKDVDLKNEYNETDYSMQEGEYVVLFEELKIEKNLYDEYNLSDCNVDEHRLMCDNDFYIFKSNDNFENEKLDTGYYDVHKFYQLDVSVINNYLKGIDDSIFESYSVIGRDDFKKVNFFSSSKKIKEAITHNYIKLNQAIRFGNSYYFGEYDLIANDYKYIGDESSRYSLIIKGDGNYYYILTKNHDLFKSLIGRIKTSE